MFPDFFSITVIKRAHCGCVHKLESVVKQNFFLVSLTFVRDTVVGGEEERRGGLTWPFVLLIFGDKSMIYRVTKVVFDE